MASDLISVKQYRDLCREIDVLDIRIRELESELKYYQKMMNMNKPPEHLSAIDYSKEHVASGNVPFSLDIIVEQMAAIQNALMPLYQVIRIKEQAKREMEKKISEFEGLEYQVAYRRIQGLSLIEIAEDMGYSVGYIKRISMSLKSRKSYDKRFREEKRAGNR